MGGVIIDIIIISAKYAYRQSLEILVVWDWIIAAFQFVIVYTVTRKIGKERLIAISFSILIPYIYLVMMFAVFRRNPNEQAILKLTPFWSYAKIIKGQKLLILECLLNVIMLIPLGVLLNNLGFRFGFALITAVIMSYSIEFLQLWLRRGLFELVDDPFHNILGEVMGYGLASLAKWFKCSSVSVGR